MAPIVRTFFIDQRPERVVSVWFDIERWPEWTPTVTAARRLDSGPLAVGSRASLQQPKLGTADWRVKTLDPARGFSWARRRPGLEMTAGHWVDPEADGARAALSFAFSGLLGPPLARLYRELCERYLMREGEALGRRCTRDA